MATELRLRGGTTAQHNSFTGGAKEVTVDIDKNTVVVHDGNTQGGFPLALFSDVDELLDINIFVDDKAELDAIDEGTFAIRVTGSGDLTSGVVCHYQRGGTPNAYQLYFRGNTNPELLWRRNGSGGWTDWFKVYTNETSKYEMKPVGEVFYLWDHLSGVNAPDNSGDASFIRLTASDSYNSGLLTNESVSGSAPLVEATAEIATGPLQGQTVHLINTEQAVLRARETSGQLQMDQMQRITGSFAYRMNAAGGTEGVFSQENAGSRVGGDDGLNATRTFFDSGDSPNARTSSGTGGETRAKNVSATAYMRIA